MHKMIRNKLFTNLVSMHHRIGCAVRRISAKLDIQKLEQESSDVDFVNEEAKLKEELIEKKRNKSRLRDPDRCILMEKNPYPEPMMHHHGTLKYLRRTYGRYGQASGVNPSICWPVKEELENVKDYERVAYPFTIQEMIEAAEQKKKEKIERINARQLEICKKMQKLEGWKQDLQNRIAKKEAEAKAAKERKERLVEEVKRHFGYTVDPKDDKFKEMLEKKEKEQRKAMKEERRKLKEARLVEFLKNKPNATEIENNENNDKEENTSARKE